MIWWDLTAVAVGGFAGGCLRSLCSSWLNRSDYAIPFGTLLVNLAGSFIVGIMLAVTPRARSAPHGKRSSSPASAVV